MTATAVPSSWPMPGAAHGAQWGASGARSGLRFGREIHLSDSPEGARALQWRLARNCSMSPRQMMGAYALLCVIALTVACFFVLAGAPMVLAFAGLELVLVGVALLVCARHATDRETLTLVDGALWVEQAHGRRVARTAFAADWLTVEPVAGQNSLVQLAGQGQRVRVGRYLRPELRGDFARELRLMLRRSRQRE